MPAASPQCWILSDGTAGMEAQALGLADAMGLDLGDLGQVATWVDEPIDN